MIEVVLGTAMRTDVGRLRTPSVEFFFSNIFILLFIFAYFNIRRKAPPFKNLPFIFGCSLSLIGGAFFWGFLVLRILRNVEALER